MKYKFLEHTADVMFEAQGKNLNEVFENAALAVFDVQCDLKKIKPKIKEKIKLKNESAGDLLFDFLEELIYLKDAKYMLFGKFDVKITQKKMVYYLESSAFGEKINPKRHELKTDVKAITLHEFFLKKTSRGWRCRVLLDI
ncbi:archease [Candidatus Woesearchaeota archaeon]|nr:archease [Candidatus Woesearchaeota archaeon]